LKLLNFLLAVAGLGMIGYGIYLFVEYKRVTDNSVTFDLTNGDQSYVSFGRPILMAVSLSSNIFDNLPKAWYVIIVFYFIYWVQKQSLGLLHFFSSYVL